MSSVTAVEPRRSAVPEWIEPALNQKAGRDPLGLMTITQDRVMPILLPGILALSSRARYFTFHPFLLDEFERRGLPPDNAALSDFIRMREFELACAVQLCPNGCGSQAAGAIGTIAAYSAVNKRTSDTIPRRLSIESGLGGYGLYYRSPLLDLSVAIPKGTPYGEDDDRRPTPVDVLQREERARGLAGAYRQAIAETEYYRDWFVGEGPIPVDVLVELAKRGCLCRLSDSPEEQALIRSLFFEKPTGEQPTFVVRDVDQRRRSFALLLRALDHDPVSADSNAAFRETVWEEFVSQPTLADPLGETLAQWAALAAKDYWQEGLSVIFHSLCQMGRARSGAGGLSPTELDALIRGPLLGDEPVVIERHAIPIDGDAGTEALIGAVASAAGGLPLERLRAFAITDGRAAAGLLLVLATIRRLPRIEEPADGWRRIGAEASERQPSILLFARLLEAHLEDGPTVGDTLVWLVKRFVIAAHEQIAYSKLPDFTFRYRWEGGRLRFYPIGGGRFEPADIRRGAMSRLSEDIGMWERADDGPALTDVGRAFVSEVLS